MTQYNNNIFAYTVVCDYNECIQLYILHQYTCQLILVIERGLRFSEVVFSAKVASSTHQMTPL